MWKSKFCNRRSNWSQGKFCPICRRGNSILNVKKAVEGNCKNVFLWGKVIHERKPLLPLRTFPRPPSYLQFHIFFAKLSFICISTCYCYNMNLRSYAASRRATCEFLYNSRGFSGDLFAVCWRIVRRMTKCRIILTGSGNRHLK